MVAIIADKNKVSFRIFSFLFVVALFADTAPALEYVQFNHLGKERNEEGRVMFEAPAGIAFEARDGQLYVLEPKDIIARKNDNTPFIPYTKKEMIARLQKEFPPSEGYNLLETTAPFIVVYTTAKPFADWYGRLLQNLHKQYVTYWKKRGIDLAEPEFPMVAVVLSSKERYLQHAKREGVNLLQEQCAYYHKLTNRIVMYDVSGIQAYQEAYGLQTRPADIQNFLRHPNSYHNIMSVVHEATHLVGFNTGMHSRYAPSPVWVQEGLAVLHEVPDQRNTAMGWTLGPHVNGRLLPLLGRYLNTPQAEPPIQKMIRDDKLFRQSDTALNNYALAWGLMYYLNQKRPKELAVYLKLQQAKDTEADDSGDIRISDFESCFGNDWDKFYKDFTDFLRKL